MGSVTDRAWSRANVWPTQTFTVTVDQQPGPITTTSPPCSPAPDATPTVTVNVNGCVPYLFNILGLSSGGCTGGFKVNRTVSFADERRGS